MKRLGAWFGSVLLAISWFAVAGAQELESPQSTVRTFLEAAAAAQSGDDVAMAEAMACLDLTGISSMREEVGRKRVLQLAEILARTGFDPDSLDEVSSARDGGVPPGEPYVLYQDPGGVGQLELVRLDGEWRFSDYTVQIAIPDLAQALEERARGPKYASAAEWLRAHAPEVLRQKAVLLEYWQWVGIALLVVLGLILDRLVIAVLTAIVALILRTQKMDADRELTRRSLRPFAMLAMALFWWGGLNWLGLPPKALSVASVLVTFVTAVAGVWGAYRLVDVLCNALERKAAKSVSKFDDLLVPLVRKSAKVFIVVFGLVFVADSMGFSVSGMLTGLGLGGLAFALAAQDTVKNFFGSLTVVLDRPFEVGDWVLIDGVEGSIEEVGFRSTRIRTFYQSVITIPNAKLLTAVVDNMGARRYRRWKTTLGVTYDATPEQLEGFCEGIRELIRQHPTTRKDYFQVYVTGFGASAIEILVYTFFDTPNWGRELQEKQRLILDIMRLAEDLGLSFAFPTQTVHLVNDSPPSGPADGVTTRTQAVRPIGRGDGSGDEGVSARERGRAAATALLSRQRLREQMEAEERAAEREAAAAAAADLATPDAGSTSSAQDERILRQLAGKNWPTRGEVGEGDAGEGGEG
ncbi:MAG: mechanosensitive ion channel family protein [Planctomycetota bacterium]|nr:MAG: mechanosensitive ion channel family protein [Planctomycetota bacterium]